MTMIGMNPDEVRGLALQMRNSSNLLEDCRAAVDHRLRTVRWLGGDAEHFTHMWGSRHTQQLRNASAALTEMAEKLLQQVREQEIASSVGANGGLIIPGWRLLPCLWEGIKWLGDRVVDGVNWLGSRALEGAKWLNDRFEEGLAWGTEKMIEGAEFVKGVWDASVDTFKQGVEWTADRLGEAWNGLMTWGVAVSKGLERHAYAWGALGSNLLGTFVGNPPTLGQLGASAALIFGTGIGVLGNAATGADQHIFAQGEPIVSGPAMPDNVPQPANLAKLTDLTMEAYNHGGVLITKVPITDDTGRYLNESGERYRYIVSIAGTMESLTSARGWTGWSPLDWPANVYAMATGKSAASEAVQIAMQNAGIPPGAEVLMTGHSQGGLLCATLAADKNFTSTYNVAGLVTYGAPVDATKVPLDINVLSVENGTDVVPALDLSLEPRADQPNVVHGYVHGGLPPGNHMQDQYLNAVESGQLDGNRAAQQSLDRMNIDRFYSDRATTQSFTISMTRP